MEDTMASAADLFSNPDLWQNESTLLNMTAANDSSVFTPVILPAFNRAINGILTAGLTITMVSLGCTMEVSEIKRHIMKPKGVVIAAVAQYGVMPLTAFSLAKVLQLSEIRAVVVLICGCCPGGSLSNILTLALQGDMNLSIVMTCCSTVLALGMMPLLLYLYCQGFPNLHSSVPYVDIIVSLVMILIPSGAGILFSYYRPLHAQIFKKVGLSLVMIAAVAIVILAGIGLRSSILVVVSLPFVVTATLMPLIGFIFGYIISVLFRLNHSEQRTVAMETGCQNIQLCIAILKLAFPPDVIGPMFLFPLVYGLLQVMEAGVLIVMFRCHQRFMHKEKETCTYQPANTVTAQEEPCLDAISLNSA